MRHFEATDCFVERVTSDTKQLGCFLDGEHIVLVVLGTHDAPLCAVETQYRAPSSKYEAPGPSPSPLLGDPRDGERTRREHRARADAGRREVDVARARQREDRARVAADAARARTAARCARRDAIASARRSAACASRRRPRSRSWSAIRRAACQAWISTWRACVAKSALIMLRS